ncbi:MAG TPA: alpha-L-fucosidase, partial [Bryobacteraceae bacterium]|nr:alpha-L-fucosidase [Bryobacteraceae bacterium]
MTRRDYLQLMGAAGALATAAQNGIAAADEAADRERRMKWWHEARFGMFIHFGVYSTIGRHEWAMEEEGIPVVEYEQYAKNFKPVPNAARAWAKLAKQAGQKYMVMTTKHHEGFCMFDTKLTNYSAPKQGPGRDLVAEYVEAARAEGRRVGFYYSLMDWHHPDGARCATDEQARR